MATRKQVVDSCRHLGVRCYDDGRTIELVCPDGMRLAGPGLHCAAVNYRGPRGNPLMSKSEAWDFLSADLRDGLETCDHPYCEWCEENGITHWDDADRIA